MRCLLDTNTWIYYLKVENNVVDNHIERRTDATS